MQCPACTGKTVIRQTIPAERRTDGRPYRYRVCEKCGESITTLEVLHSEIASTNSPQPPASKLKAAIPVAPQGSTLYDLEGGLEAALPDAVKTIKAAVAPGTPAPDRIRVEAAKWLIDDRRKWRMQMAEQANLTGTAPTDPTLAQLANILALMPDQVES